MKLKNTFGADAIFAGSLAGSAVCMTVITLFTVMNKRDQSYADEFFALTNIIFIAVGILAFINANKQSPVLQIVIYYTILLALFFLLASSISLIFIY